MEIEINRPSPQPQDIDNNQRQRSRRDPLQDVFREPRLRVGDFIPGSVPKVDFRRGPQSRGRGYKMILFSWFASSIDILCSLAGSLLLLACFSVIQRTSFVQAMQFFNGSLAQFTTTVFVGFVYLYKITLRIFLGYTLGEWVCGLRLGNPSVRALPTYGLRVLLRSSLTLCTGVVLLPTLSLLVGKDLAGQLSGVSLYEVQASAQHKAA